MYESGELRDAPRLSEEQLHMQINCRGCHRTMSLPKKTRRKKLPRIRDRKRLGRPAGRPGACLLYLYSRNLTGLEPPMLMSPQLGPSRGSPTTPTL